MAAILDDMLGQLPTATDVMEKMALEEAERASATMRLEAIQESEKKALVDRLSKPSGVSDEEAIKRAATIIQNAMRNGLTEVQVYRFPNTVCTDNGRAVNQQEAGWENTLTGIPKEIFEFCKRHLRPRGYKMRAQILEFPGGVPG